jgi:antitoxin component of MazEF toxin-antitoxin module
METTIVKIGNSKGLIIPKKLLTAFGEATQVDIKAIDGALIK